MFDVGYSGFVSNAKTYAEKYNGSSWTHQTTPNVGSDAVWITGGAAVSANEVFAVGYHGGPTPTTPYKPFAMMWNGTSWVPSQPLTVGTVGEDLLNAATAIPGTKDALAVGFVRNFGGLQPLIERVHCL
jgi:hypothetical protein